MSHLDEGTVHAWLDGALPADESARVEAHARDCAQCAAMVAEARGFIAGASRIVSSLDVVRGNVLPASVGAAQKRNAAPSLWKTLKFTPARAAIAATLLIGVASMFTLRRQSPELTPRMAVMDSVASAPAPLAPQPAAPSLSSAAGAGVAANRAAPSEPRAKARAQAGASAKRETAARSDAVESMKAAAPSLPDPRASRDSRLQLSEVVVTGASSAARDSSTVGRASAPVQDAAGRFARRIPVATAQPSVDATVPGCYRLLFDSPVDLHGFPNPFRLAHDSLSGLRSVYGVGADGRDSVLNGASWRMMLTSVVVSVGDARANPARLLFAPDSLRATFSAVGANAAARLERTPCPR